MVNYKEYCSGLPDGILICSPTIKEWITNYTPANIVTVMRYEDIVIGIAIHGRTLKYLYIRDEYRRLGYGTQLFHYVTTPDKHNIAVCRTSAAMTALLLKEGYIRTGIVTDKYCDLYTHSDFIKIPTLTDQSIQSVCMEYLCTHL